MDSLRNVLTTCAGVLFFTGFVPYIVTTIKGTTKPTKVTWIIWASLDTITIVGMYFENTLNGQIVGAVMGAWVIVALALLYGKPGWERQDKWCLCGAVLAVVLWKLYNNPTVGIVVSNSVVFFGSFQTFASAWREPENEDKIAWTIWWTSCVCAVISLPSFQPADSAQPLTFFAIETIMLYLVYIHKRDAEQNEEVGALVPEKERCPFCRGELGFMHWCNSCRLKIL